MSGPYEAYHWGDGHWYVKGPGIGGGERGVPCDGARDGREKADLLNRAARHFRAPWPKIKVGGKEIDYQCEKCGNRIIGGMTCRMGERTVVDCVDCGHTQEL